MIVTILVCLNLLATCASAYTCTALPPPLLLPSSFFSFFFPFYLSALVTLQQQVSMVQPAHAERALRRARALAIELETLKERASKTSTDPVSAGASASGVLTNEKVGVSGISTAIKDSACVYALFLLSPPSTHRSVTPPPPPLYFSPLSLLSFLLIFSSLFVIFSLSFPPYLPLLPFLPPSSSPSPSLSVAKAARHALAH